VGCRLPHVLDNGRLSNQEISSSRCPLSGSFRSMIEPQHQKSRSFASREQTRCGPAYTARRYVHQPTQGYSRYHPEDRRPIWPVGLDATLGKRTGLHIFGIARRAGGTCLVPKGQRSRCVKSVHFYFPNDLDANTQTTNHMVVDVAGFSSGVAAFASRCERAQ
jgi:hypothetical protein